LDNDSTYLNDSIDVVAANLANLIVSNIDTVESATFINDSTLQIFSGDGDSVEVSLASLATDAELAQAVNDLNIALDADSTYLNDSIDVVAANLNTLATTVQTNTSAIGTNATNISNNATAISTHISNDNDTDSTNELISNTYLSGDTLYIVEAGDTIETYMGGISTDTLNFILENDSNYAQITSDNFRIVYDNSAAYNLRNDRIVFNQANAGFLFEKDHNSRWDLAFTSNSNILDTSVYSGSHNFIFGRDAGRDLTSGSGNVAIGNAAMRENETGTGNIAIGGAFGGLIAMTSGSSNIALGNSSGNGLISGSNNIFLNNSGASGNYSNRIYIGNTIFGSNDTVRINGVFRTRYGSDTLSYPTSDGSNGFVLTTDGNGLLTFQAPNNFTDTITTVDLINDSTLALVDNSGDSLFADLSNLASDVEVAAIESALLVQIALHTSQLETLGDSIQYLDDRADSISLAAQANTSAIGTNTTNISNNASAISTHISNDNDTDSTNELISTTYLSGDTFYIVEAGDTLSTFLGGSNGDNLGNQTLDSNLRTNGYWISNDGDDEGLFVNSLGNVGIGTSSPSSAMDIASTQDITINVINNAPATSGGDHKAFFGQVNHSNTSAKNMAVYGVASGSTDENFGVRGEASGTAGIKIGVYGSASGGGSRFSGYFEDANVYMSEGLSIGSNSPSYLQTLDVEGGIIADSVYTDSLFATRVRADELFINNLLFPDASSASANDVLTFNGTGYVWQSPAAGTDNQNLSLNVANDSILIEDGNGIDINFLATNADVSDSITLVQSQLNDSINVVQSALESHISNDADIDSTNEIISSAYLLGNSLIIKEGEDSVVVDLNQFVNSAVALGLDSVLSVSSDANGDSIINLSILEVTDTASFVVAVANKLLVADTFLNTGRSILDSALVSNLIIGGFTFPNVGTASTNDILTFDGTNMVWQSPAASSDNQNLSLNVASDSILVEDGNGIDINFLATDLELSSDSAAVADSLDIVEARLNNYIVANTDTSASNELDTFDFAGVVQDSLKFVYNGDTINTIAISDLNVGDNLGDHALDTNLITNGRFISGDGDSEGIFIDSDGKVGLGINNPAARLDVIDTNNTLAARFWATRSGTGTNTGINARATSGATNLGINARAFGGATNYGIQAIADSAGSSAIGMIGYAQSASSTGNNFGVVGQAGNSLGTNVGVFGILWGTTTAADAAVTGSAEGTGINTAFNATATNANGSGGINRGYYANVFGGDTNYAAYFESGAVYIADSLIMPKGAGPGLVLTSDADGLASWQSPGTGADNLGNHNATQRINLNGNYLSGDGDDEGIFVATDGRVFIDTNAAISDERFTIKSNNQQFGWMNTTGEVSLGTWLYDSVNTTDIGAGQLGTYSNHRLDFIANNSAARMSIHPSGNISIGTTQDKGFKFLIEDSFQATSGIYQMSQFYSSGTATSGATQRGLTSYIQGTDGSNTAAFSISNGTSAGTNIGVENYAANAVYNTASYNQVLDMTGNSSGNRGIQSYVRANGTGWNEGVNSQSVGNHSGTNIGIIGRADSANTNTGISGYASRTPAGANFAIGIRGAATDTSSGINYGMYGEAANSTFINRGVVGVISNTVTTNDAAIYGIANGVGNNISLYGRANITNTGGINYGLYTKALGADTNYAAYFESGAVYVGDSLIIPNGAGAGLVLTSDANGIASWQSPGSGADNLGNHTATQALNLNGNYLSGDGDDEGLFINSNGFAGIGTNTPEVKFNIVGSNDVNLTNGAGMFQIGDTSGSNMIFDENEIQARFAGNNNPGQLLLQPDGGELQINGNVTNQNLMYQNGNLGLGTYSPSAKIDVVGGGIKTETLQITTSPQSGYVLTSDASGNATWQAPAASADTNVVSGSISGTDIVLERDLGADITIDISTLATFDDLSDSITLVQSQLNDSINVVQSALATHISNDLDLSITNELVDSAKVVGTDLQIFQAGSTTPITADLAAFSGSDTNVVSGSISGTDIVLERDFGADITIDISSLATFDDLSDSITLVQNQLNDSINVVQSALNDSINVVQSDLSDSIDLVQSALATHISNDLDLSITNELVDSAKVVGTDLQIFQAGSTTPITADLAAFSGSDTNVVSGSISGTDIVLVRDFGSDVSIDISTLATDSEVTTITNSLEGRIDSSSTAIQNHIAADADLSATNELQDLSLNGDTLFISGGDSVILSSLADNLGNHNATQALNLNGNYLSGDTDNEGIFVNTTGLVGIGTGSPTSRLHVLDTSNSTSAQIINSSNTSTNTALSLQANGIGGNTNTGLSLVASGATFSGNFGASINVTGANNNNYGLYVDVTGATKNYAAQFVNGDVLIKDTLEVDSAIVYNHSTVAEGYYLRTTAEGLVYADTLTASAANTCPSGYTQVNSQYCIQNATQTATSWFTAASTCSGVDAKLPTWSEWYVGVQETGVTGPTLGNWEWIDQLSQNNASIVGGGSGTAEQTRGADAPENDNVFRCVYYLNN
jgi:hypothetical protein